MRYFLVELFCFCCPLFILSQNIAEVGIGFHSKDVKKVSPFLFGNFIEYYMCFQNGNSGMWAQELTDRGFDIKYMDRGVSDFWETWSSHYSEDEKWKLVKGGFNQNAIYFQRLTKNQNETKLGIRQHIYTTENQGYDFYVYLRGDSNINDVKIRIMDVNLIDLITEVSLGKPDTIWKKHTAKIPEIKDRGQVILIICYQDSGTLDLDEASLMPENNINGIRKEYYDIFEEWKPTILRYPGGWFVEYSGYKWEMGTGNIDKRAVYPTYEAVRMDFGIDEFLRFCIEFEIEPHLVTNFLEGSPEESASLVEYCNGDISSKYGYLRVSNGHVEPYNVKIWEIGNEIWEHPYDYATGFVNFYDKMNEKDQSIECIISADVWQWKPFFDTLVDITKDKCEYYGWHWTQLAYPKIPVTNEDMYLSMVGASFETENYIDSVHKWIIQKGLSNKMTQAITEIWSSYNPDAFEWTHDTTSRGASLENGLWMATQNNACLKKCDKVKIVEKTFAVATLRMEIDSKTYKRHYYKTPSYWACSMLRNHVGNELLPTIVNCENIPNPITKVLFRLWIYHGLMSLQQKHMILFI